MVRKGAWGIMVFLAAGVAAYSLANALNPSIRAPFVTGLFATKGLATFGHLAGGGVALLVGALQFSSWLRWNRPRVHRALGMTYVAAVLVGGASALVMAPTSNGGPAGHFGFGMLGALWVTATAIAFVRARARDFEGHRAWMIRSYALCLAAVTLRIYLPFSLGSGIPFEEAYPAIAWMCWVPNLVIAEWVVLRSSVAPVEPTGGA